MESGADLLRIASGDVAGLRTFRGDAHISVRIQGLRQNGLAVILFRRPNHMKLEMASSMGVRLMAAASWGDSLRIFLPGSLELYEGLADSDILGRITGVDLGFWEPWKAVLGVTSTEGWSGVDLERDADRLVLWIRENGGMRRLTFDPQGLTLSGEEVYDESGGLVVRRAMWDYRDVNGVVLPRSIALYQGDDEIRIRYVNCAINGEVSDDQMRMRVPEGAIRVR